ncbi:MAG: efflux RND transporter permease subunit [Betaproteobacteria bacterium]|nr:efflux RND transporter permease subunit [Betaproteobacteria bacterium]
MTPVMPPGATDSGRFNLSEWALHNRSLVRFLIAMCAIFGAIAYTKLGQSEDPPFTFKVMVVRTNWPGASAREVEQQLTDRIERKLQEVPNVDWVRSYSKPGESMVFFAIRDTAPAASVPEAWYQVRKKIGDARGSLPSGIQGPYFNDEFGDTYTNIYAIVGDGFAYRELKTVGDKVRAELLRVPAVAKVDFIGEQEEKVFVEVSNAKLATLGIEPAQIYTTLAAQNVVAASGTFDTPTDRIALRPSGAYGSLDAIRDLSIRAGGRVLRLGDIATVSRGYADPPQQKMRVQGREALGIGITMGAGGDVIHLGRDLDAEIARLRTKLPVGVEIVQVASMPAAVQRSVNQFVRSLAEAVLIVLAVSLVSLGLRTGLVVAVSIPLVLAATFLGMWMLDIGLHKISLGALILSLGLLVDDAIIAVEMMAIKLEQGYDRFRAASFAYTSTAFPMLTGTLVTVAGFLPIATAKSGTGEYTRSIFQVSAIALIASWVAAVVVIPWLGYRMLPSGDALHRPSLWARLRSRLTGRPLPAAAASHDASDPDAVYRTPFYTRLRAFVDACVERRFVVLGGTLVVFAAAIAAFRFVPQQFFPSSSRPELLVDLRLPEGSSFAATLAQAKKLEAILDKEQGIESYVAYVGSGSPRFYLPLDQQLQQSNFAQFMLVAASNAERERLRTRLLERFETDFPELRGRVSRLENGPPVGFPVQFRVSGEDIGEVRRIAREVAAVMRTDPDAADKLEDGVVWRRNRLPTITVRSDVRGDAQGPDVANRIDPKLAPIRATLPLGYRIELGGAIEDSARGQKSIAAGVPLLVVTVLTLLMIQLRSLARTLMVVLTAPLGLVGVVAALLAFGKPFGFVAMLGTIALSGIIMRNSVILVDQIDTDIRSGVPAWDAIVGATVRRFRPIVLTAAAAVLALIPLTRSDFFGPMAVAMMGGLVIATVLTLVFLPALYATWFRVRRPGADASPAAGEAAWA